MVLNAVNEKPVKIENVEMQEQKGRNQMNSIPGKNYLEIIKSY